MTPEEAIDEADGHAGGSEDEAASDRPAEATPQAQPSTGSPGGTEDIFDAPLGPRPDDNEDAPWLDPESESALRRVIPHHMDPRSAVLHARWWQLEPFLRSLAYVELRALHGRSWVETVKVGNVRLERDAMYTHLMGPDNDNPLAYLDYSQLLDVLDSNWAQVGYALFDKASWDGRQAELKRIRHRIGHMRRPHADDVGRVEQTLRDLERGAFIAYASYNRRRTPDPKVHRDPVTQGWIARNFLGAKDLLDHAERQYGVELAVRSSRRPWGARKPADLQAAPGHLWHAEFLLHSRHVDVPAMWREMKTGSIGPLLLHLEVSDPTHIGVSFSAADDAELIADAIDRTLQLVLSHAHRFGRERWSKDHVAEARRYRDLDYRIVSGDGWTIVDESTVPISNFGANGGVETVPNW